MLVSPLTLLWPLPPPRRSFFQGVGSTLEVAAIRRPCIRVLSDPFFFLLNKMRRSSPVFFEKKDRATSAIIRERLFIQYILCRRSYSTHSSCVRFVVISSTC
jgi:hypothetical protein